MTGNLLYSKNLSEDEESSGVRVIEETNLYAVWIVSVPRGTRLEGIYREREDAIERGVDLARYSEELLMSVSTIPLR